jgi:esterase/lipase superfamily enzyme
MLVFGHSGPRVLAFPASKHPFYDWENRGLVASLAEMVEQGRLQLFCVDQVDGESWYGWNRDPAQRASRQNDYDGYLLREVVPFTRSINPDSMLIAAGPSFGGYHAVNFALRHPDVVGRVLGMSGIYDLSRFLGGHYDENVYFNNPVDFIANERDPARLMALKRLEVILAVGRDDALIDSNRRLSDSLWKIGVWHALRVWDGFAHDWPVWAQMLPLYIGGHD